MRLMICLTAALALCACSKQPKRRHAADNAAEVTKPLRPRRRLPSDQRDDLDFTDKTQEASRNRSTPTAITSAVPAEHIDHGTAVMKDGKACFTSAMTRTARSAGRPRSRSASRETTSDKGEKLTVTRVAYAADDVN